MAFFPSVYAHTSFYLIYIYIFRSLRENISVECMASSKHTRDESGRHSGYSEPQSSKLEPGYSSPPTLPSSTSRQTRSDISKAQPGFDDDVRSLRIASPRAGQVVNPPTTPPKLRPSRTGVTRSSGYTPAGELENGVGSSEIALSAPLTPPTSPSKCSPQRDDPSPEILSPKIASAAPFTPPTRFTRELSPETNVSVPDVSRVLKGLEDNVRPLAIASASPLTPPKSPPRNKSALTARDKPAEAGDHIKVSSLKTNLGLGGSKCCCMKDNGEPCRMPRSENTDDQINTQLKSMITLTRSSVGFKSELEKLVILVHCRYHLSPKFKNRRIETWSTVFPDGEGDTGPSVEDQIRRALGEPSTQCIGITTTKVRCTKPIGGRKVQNCSKSIDEIVKSEVYLDDGYLRAYLEVLSANMHCSIHITRRLPKHVVRWEESIRDIRRKASLKVIPSIESTSSGGPKSQTHLPDAQGPTPKDKKTPVLRSRALLTPSSRSLTPDLARDPATFWPETYDMTPFDILVASNRLAFSISSYRLIQSTIELPLDRTDQQDGYVYLYEVDGNSGFVKIGYTGRSIEVRHQEWEFDCNRLPRILYPSNSSPAIPVRHARRVEALCHAELDHRRIRIYCKGCLKQHIEWFEISTAEAIAVIRKWSQWAATLPYEMARLRSGAWQLKEEQKQKARNIDRLMEELSLYNGESLLDVAQ